jgi:undecaprenyl-diphosphatase
VFIGVLQGVTELFPVSSLGHSVIVPALFGWDRVVSQQSASESSFLAFLVGLHVATALALVVYFRADWTRIVRAFFHTLATRRAETPDERLAWLLVIGTSRSGSRASCWSTCCACCSRSRSRRRSSCWRTA